ISGISALAYLLYKKSTNGKQNDSPSIVKKFTNKVAYSIIKPLAEVAEDVPSYPMIVNNDW
ncbi:MAG: hypothetical protein H7334_04000, partial [Ferruginibacter sp.]|nr:hypothetical protein [Ferruginibacter sp.]